MAPTDANPVLVVIERGFARTVDAVGGQRKVQALHLEDGSHTRMQGR